MFATIVSSIDYQTNFFFVNTVAKQSKCFVQNIRMECVCALTSYRHKGQADIPLLFEYTLIIIGNYRKVMAKLRRHAYKITYSSVAYCLRVANFGTIFKLKFSERCL